MSPAAGEGEGASLPGEGQGVGVVESRVIKRMKTF